MTISNIIQTINQSINLNVRTDSKNSQDLYNGEEQTIFQVLR